MSKHAPSCGLFASLRQDDPKAILVKDVLNLLQEQNIPANGTIAVLMAVYAGEKDIEFTSLSAKEWVDILKPQLTSMQEEQQTEKVLHKQGIMRQKQSIHVLYTQFHEDFGSLENDIKAQLSTAFTSILDRFCHGLDGTKRPKITNQEADEKIKYPAFKDMMRIQVLHALGEINCGSANKGVSYIVGIIHDQLVETVVKEEQKIEELRLKGGKEKAIEKHAKKVLIIKKLLQPNNWVAAVQLLKKELAETERLKVKSSFGIETMKQLSVEDDTDMEQSGREDQIRDAEETNMEHWMEISDTINQVTGVAAQFRSFCNTLFKRTTVTKKVNGEDVKKVVYKSGLLGFPVRFDSKRMYAQLMSMRHKMLIRNSAQFYNALELVAHSDEGYNEEFKEFCAALYGKLTFYKTDTPIERKEKIMYRTLMYNNMDKMVLGYTAVRTYKGADGELKVSLGNISQKESEYESKYTEKVNINTEDGDGKYLIYGTTLNKTLALVFNSKISKYLSQSDDQLQSPEQVAYLDDLVKDFLQAAQLLNPRFNIKNYPDADSKRDLAKRLLGIVVSISNSSTVKTGISAILEGAKAENLVDYDTTMTISTQDSLYFNGSTYYAITQQCFLSKYMEKISAFINENKRKGLKEYLEKEFLNNRMYAEKIENDGNTTYKIYHSWIHDLYEWACEDPEEGKLSQNYSKDFIDNIKKNNILRGIGYWDGYLEFKKFTELQNLQFHLYHFLETWSNCKNRDCAMIPAFVLGDADKVMYIPTTLLEFYNGNYKTQLVNVLRQELACYNQLKAFNEAKKSIGVKTLRLTDKPFSYFPKLQEKITAGELLLDDYKTVKDFELLPQETKEKYITYLLDNSDLTSYELLLKESLENELEIFVNNLVLKGLAKRDIRGNLHLNAKIFPKAYTVLLEEELESSSARANNLDIFKVLFLQTFYGQIQHQTFHGISPMLYDSTQDMQKRWKEMSASGNTLDMAALYEDGTPVCKSEEEFTQKVAYFDDIAVNTVDKEGSSNTNDNEKWEELTMFGKLLKALGIERKLYRKGSSLTDGQAYRSLDSYRKIMIMSGQWYLNPANEEFYNTIQKVRNEGIDLYAAENKELLRSILSMPVCFQPLKPFYYGKEKVSAGTIDIGVQMKYSERILVPELLPRNSQERMVGLAMQQNGIDLLASTKCVKVGGWGSAKMDFTSQEALNASLKHGNNCEHHTLGLGGYLIQNNVPDHMNSPRGEGTQLSKILGFAGLTDAKAKRSLMKISDYLSPKDANGNVIESQRVTEIKLTGEKSIKLVDLNGKEGGTKCRAIFQALKIIPWQRKAKSLINKLKDPKKMTALMEDSISADSRIANDNYLNLEMMPDGHRALPNTDGSTSADNEAKIQSFLRKEVIKQTSEGGMAVQIAGIDQDLDMIFNDECYEKETITREDGTTYTDYKYDEHGKRILREDITESELLEKGNIEYAEGAATWFGTYIDASGRRVKLDYLDYVDFETGRLLMPDGSVCKSGHEEESKLNQEFPGILDILTYRVPTERAYSTIAVRTVKFYPPCLGGVLALPAAYTTIAGFDFDIDKLYMMFKAFKRIPSTDENFYSESQRKIIWSELYKKYPKLFDLLKECKAENKDNTRHYNEYWEDAVKKDTDSKVQSSSYVSVFPLGTDKTAYFEEGVNLVHFASQLMTLDPEKALTDQSVDIDLINNLKLMYYLDRWKSLENRVEKLTPGGFYNIERVTGAMQRITRGDLEGIDSAAELFRTSESYEMPNDNPANMTTVSHYQAHNTIYGQLIGLGACTNINQSYVAMFSELKLKSPIRFGNMLERAARIAQADGLVGTDIVERFKDADGKIDSAGLLAELLASAVDAVKKATLEYFNISPETFDLASTMIRLGAEYEDVGLILNQPIVREALLKLERGESYSFMQALDLSLHQMFCDENATPKYPKDVVELDRETLFQAIKHYKTGYAVSSPNIMRTASSIDPEKVANVQYAVKLMLDKCMAASTILSSIVQGTRPDSANATGSSIASMQKNLMSYEALNDAFARKDDESPDNIISLTVKEDMGNSVYKTDDLLDEDGNVDDYDAFEDLFDNPLGLPQMLYYVTKAYLKATSKEFPYEHSPYKQAREIFKQITQKGNVPEEMLKYLNAEFSTYIMAKIGGCIGDFFMGTNNGNGNDPRFNPNFRVTVSYAEEPARSEMINGEVVEYAEKRTTKEIYFKNYLRQYFPIEVSRFKNIYEEAGLEIPLILKCAQTTTFNGRSYLRFNTNIEGGDNKLAIKLSFFNMWNSDNPAERQMAELLFFYNLHVRGMGGFGTNVCTYLISERFKQIFSTYRDLCVAIETIKADPDGNFYFEYEEDTPDGPQINRFEVGNVEEFVQGLLYNHSEQFYQYHTSITNNKNIEDMKEIDAKLNGGEAWKIISCSATHLSTDEDALSRTVYADKPFPMKIYKGSSLMKECRVFTTSSDEGDTKVVYLRAVPTFSIKVINENGLEEIRKYALVTVDDNGYETPTVYSGQGTEFLAEDEKYSKDGKEQTLTCATCYYKLIDINGKTVGSKSNEIDYGIPDLANTLRDDSDAGLENCYIEDDVCGSSKGNLIEAFKNTENPSVVENAPSATMQEDPSAEGTVTTTSETSAGQDTTGSGYSAEAIAQDKADGTLDKQNFVNMILEASEEQPILGDRRALVILRTLYSKLNTCQKRALEVKIAKIFKETSEAFNINPLSSSNPADKELFEKAFIQNVNAALSYLFNSYTLSPTTETQGEDIVSYKEYNGETTHRKLEVSSKGLTKELDKIASEYNLCD